MSNKTITTPKGEFLYPRFQRPDTKYDEDGVYKVTVAFTPEQFERLQPIIDEAFDDHIAALKKKYKGKKVRVADKPYSKEVRYDPVTDTESETGRIVASFKLKAVGRKRVDKDKSRDPIYETWSNAVRLYDAKNNAIVGEAKEEIRIGSGTIGKVGFKIRPYPEGDLDIPKDGAGLSLQLRSAKILELVEWESKSEFESDEDDEDEAGSFVMKPVARSTSEGFKDGGDNRQASAAEVHADDEDEEF